MLGLGPTEIIIILAIALIIFGPSRLPEIARTIGKAVNAFKKSSQDIEAQVKKEFLSSDKEPSDKEEGKENPNGGD